MNANGVDENDSLEDFLRDHEPGKYSRLQAFESEFLPTVDSVKALADACRTPGWRWPLARAGFLSVIQDLSTDPNQRDVSQQILRFLANCCSDNNSCRDLVLKDLDKLSTCLKDDQLFDFTVVALNNICDDYDAAFDAALRHNVHEAIASALYKKEPNSERQSISMAITLLISLVYRAVSTAKLPQVLSVSFIDETLVLPLKCPDFDLYVELVEMAIMLFQDEDAQRWIAQRGSMLDILSMLEDIHGKIDRIMSKQEDATTPEVDANADNELTVLSKYANEIRSSLCDIAGMPEYRKEKLRGSHFTAETLEKWLAEWDCDWKMHTAALVLGNVTQSDTIATLLVNDFELHHAVTGAIKRTNDKQVLYACAVLLRNLCLPENNTLVRASVESFIAARKVMLHHEHDKRLFIAGLRLLRQCIRDFGACQLLILKEPAESKLSLQTLLHFWAEYAEDDINFRAEIGRAGVMMYRTCNRSRCPTVPNLLHILNRGERFIEAMADLTILGFDTHLEGEGWFGLALAAKLKDGASAVYRALKKMESVDKLAKRIHVKEAHTVQQDAGKTRENARVLAMTLVDVIPDELGEDDLRTFKTVKRLEELLVL